MLSTAQDYRPGAFGDQYHVWQATLEARAIVFTTHPADRAPRGHRAGPTATATGPAPARCPGRPSRAPPPSTSTRPAVTDPGPGLLGSVPVPRLHPRLLPHRGVRRGGALGQLDVRSQRRRLRRPVVVARTGVAAPRPRRVFTNGLTEAFDLVAPGGPDNVWVVEVADAADWGGDFAAFRAAFEAAAPVVTELPATDGAALRRLRRHVGLTVAGHARLRHAGPADGRRHRGRPRRLPPLRQPVDARCPSTPTTWPSPPAALARPRLRHLDPHRRRPPAALT